MAETATITTRIPARLDRLPWARFHWLIVTGLGTVWILDGLEVTIVGSVASRMTSPGSGIHISTAGIGLGAALYVAGACVGALLFGQLTDRFGRRKLFMITLGVYIAATVATAFSFSLWYFCLVRFITGSGIGGEYSAINSAIDELIPARVRGTVDLAINGSYWAGAAAGSGAALFFLSSIFPTDVGWRVTFGVGAVLGLAILLVRRNVPESPRWLFIHGQEEEAERIVTEIEKGIEKDTGVQLDRPDKEITVRQRESISFREIAKVAFKAYPKRTILGLALFVGQAFLYNGIVFNLGTLFTTFYKVSSSFVPVFIVIYSVGNLAGPLLLGRLFDTVGRKPMITATYLGSAATGALLAVLFVTGSLSSAWAFLALIVVTFFIASAGASSAYLTVSEIFPMETRALAIAFFYAIGTGAGGIAGPLLFASFIGSGHRSLVSVAFLIGAGMMALGGFAELFFGVKAERTPLEDIALPMTAEDAQSSRTPERTGGKRPAAHPERVAALEARAEAEELRAAAAEHRATALTLKAEGDAEGDRVDIEGSLGEIAELRAAALDERARSHEVLAPESDEGEDEPGEAERHRALAAEARADALEHRAAAEGASSDEEAKRYGALAEAASARARAEEHRGEEEEARQEATNSKGAGRAVGDARARLHRRWSEREDALARAAEARAEGEGAAAAAHKERAGQLEQIALAAEEELHAAEHLQAAAEERAEQEGEEDRLRAEREAAERRHSADEREEAIRRRLAERLAAERTGLRRFRPGVGTSLYSPGMVGAPPYERIDTEEDLEREIEAFERALDEHGTLERGDLERVVGARYWGPGRYRHALREAVRTGRIIEVSRRSFGLPRDASSRQRTSTG